MRLSLFLVVLIVPMAALADDVEPKGKKVVAREIKVDVDGLPTGARWAREITSKADLEKVVKDKEVREKILKQVDLKKEFLVFFQWSGSPRDEVQMEEKKGEVTFTYKRDRAFERGNIRLGDTDRAKLFALPLKTKYRLVE